MNFTIVESFFSILISFRTAFLRIYNHLFNTEISGGGGDFLK